MKYWWLEQYKNLKNKDFIRLKDDVNYFITLPKNYETRYLTIKDTEISQLDEEDLLILLKKILDDNDLNYNILNSIIEKLLTYPDNSFPASDYNLEEMLNEIKLLYKNLPLKNKMENNNIAICYHCMNIFYVDKIKKFNKLNLCLCPYCHSNKLYFDNDYIPMNYSFIKLAYLYYHISDLGCSFIEIKKIMKKGIKVELGDSSDNLNFTEMFATKLTPIYEKELMKHIYDELLQQDRLLNRKIEVMIDDIGSGVPNKLILFLICLMEVLSNTVYLKEIIIKTNSKKIQTYLKSLLKTIIDFSC